MKLSYEQLKEFVSIVVTAGRISIADFNATRDNTAGLLDKIGKMVTLDSVYIVDKLAKFDGEYLSFGKTIEEWQQDLIMIEDKSDVNVDQKALQPHRPTYRPVFYSYTIGKKVISTTIDYNDLERACHFADQFVSLISMKYKRLEDSMAVYRYGVKREMIAKFYDIASKEMAGTYSVIGTGASGDEWELHGSDSYTINSQWGTVINAKADNGLFLLEVSGGTAGNSDDQYNGTYIVVKEIAAASTKSLKELVEEGYLIKFDLITEIAKPVDTSTGEAFIKQLKKDVEVASDLSEGHSLNGNSLGATEGLTLIVKQSVLPSLEVDTWAGAFNKELLALPAETIVVKDFGSANSKLYAVLVDSRAMRLHNTYNATFENLNGYGAFLNIFKHTEDTAYISRNCFVKFFVEP